MAYLDLSPMLQAMRARPSEFEMQGSYLRHISSHHLLNFDIWGNARVHARCDCAMLDVSREQSDEMKSAIAAWRVVYWEPHLAQLEAETGKTLWSWYLGSPQLATPIIQGGLNRAGAAKRIAEMDPLRPVGIEVIAPCPHAR